MENVQKSGTETDKNADILEKAMAIGSIGYCYHNKETGEFRVKGEYIKSMFTADELELMEAEGIWRLIEEEDQKSLILNWRKSVKTNQPFEQTVRLNSKNNGVCWFKIHAMPNREGFICFFEDVTELVNYQQELIRAKEEAEKALQSKNMLLGRLSHEIRTPMNAVIGIADALMYYDVDPALNPKLELIQSSADNILRILDRTLSHAKLDAQKLTLDNQNADPGQVVEKVCNLWKHQAKKNGTTIYCVIDKSVPDEIIFDKFRYEQCLNNLLSNAVKFTENGIIKVVLTVVDADTNPKLVMAIKDTGIGMSLEQQNRIFEAFEQADNSISGRFGGTGLGMNITKRLIELMGGSISVRSELGKGTIFAISLPIESKTAQTEVTAEDANVQDEITLEEKPEEQEPPNKEKPGDPYSKLKILVADDNPTNHVVVKSLLNHLVSDIYTAMNGRDVIDILETEHVDIILMDIHMPVMDGIEATLAIRSSEKPWSDVKIIALTADPQYQQKRLCMNIGMDDALGKPVKMAEILQAFDNVLNEQPQLEVFDQAV